MLEELMTIKITIDGNKIEYRQPKTVIGKMLAILSNWLRKVSLVTVVNPPYEFKGIKKLLSILRFDQIGQTIRIEPKNIEYQFQVHQERLTLYNRLSTIIYFSAIVFMTLLLLATLIIASITTQSALLRSLISGSFNTLSGVLGILLAILAARIASLLLDKRFADSLILASSLYLVIDLQKHNNLSNPDFRRTILERIRILRRNVLLLSQTFIDSNIINNQKAEKHLRNIEIYIREREGWVITPKKGTLKLLRSDFDKLALILISGHYGEFSAKIKQRVKEIPSVPLTLTDKSIRFVGFILPYLILSVLYFKPEYIKNIGLDITTTFLVSIIWILLTIDARLKLGFVERIAGLAKTMKELR